MTGHGTTWVKGRRENSPSNLVQSRSHITSGVFKTPALCHVTQHLLRLDAQPYVCTLRSLSHQVPLSRVPPIQPCSLAMPTQDALRATNAVPESAGPKKHGGRNTELPMRSLRRLNKQVFPWASHKMGLPPPQGLISTARIHKALKPQAGSL